jgi:hypothetical protein
MPGNALQQSPALLQHRVGAQMNAQALLNLADLVLEVCQVGHDELPQEAGGLFEVKAVAFLLAHRLQRPEPAHQSLELTLLRWRRRPQRRLLGGHEAGNERRIRFVGLGPRQFAFGKRVGAGRIDHADRHVVLMQKQREGIPVAGSRLQAGVDRRGGLLAQPGFELLETHGGIGELAVTSTSLLQQSGVERAFSHIKAQ